MKRGAAVYALALVWLPLSLFSTPHLALSFLSPFKFYASFYMLVFIGAGPLDPIFTQRLQTLPFTVPYHTSMGHLPLLYATSPPLWISGPRGQLGRPTTTEVRSLPAGLYVVFSFHVSTGFYFTHFTSLIFSSSGFFCMLSIA